MALPNWLATIAAGMPAVPDLEALMWPAAIIVALTISAGIAVWFTRDRYAPIRAMRARFIYGVPWGSVLVLGLVVLVYLFVQDGRTSLTQPVFLPYVNWSYLYPTGVILAPLSHGSLGHFISNISVALVLAPIAEYIYGHYPPDDPWRLERPLWDRPVVRAVVIFPGVAMVVAIVSSLFAWGPVIGFSGVVFALAGFTAIKYPLITLIAILARSALSQLGNALFNPVVEASVRETVSQPGWVGVSFQGHALGFLLGVVLAIALLHRRPHDSPASPLRLWFGLSVLALTMSLWAIWFSQGSERYVLYQGLGVALVFVGVALILIAALTSGRSIWGGLTRRHVAIVGILVPLVLLSLVAIPMNVLEVSEYDRPDNAVSVGDYDVFYTDGVENRLRPAIGLMDDSPGTSRGVIVVSESRHLWTTAKSSSNLERSGSTTIRLGGIGWAASVHVDREGWSPVGNDTVYRVNVSDGDTVSTTFLADERMAQPTVEGHRIAIGTQGEHFTVIVTDPTGEQVTAPIPDENESVELGELTIERDDDELVARAEDTTVGVASQE